MSGCDGADDEGGVGPGDRVFARFGGAERVLVVEGIEGDGFGRGGCSSGDGGDVIVALGVE